VSSERKPLREQVLVITGASSGIGLATARAAAAQGARLVLAARSVAALEQEAAANRAAGGDALAVECDVAVREQVERVAREALTRFGGIDTWINNAGVGMYGRLEQFDDADARRLFDVNFWGVVYGSLAALPHLRASGGTLINVGSEVSEAAVALLGIYAASKHAVKGFTDTLRIELEDVEKGPVRVTLIEPQAVDTPFPQHARNYMDREPRLPPPTIDAEKVAAAILGAAVRPSRVERVGVMAKLDTVLAKVAPAIGDKFAAKQADRQQRKEPPRHPEGALHQPSAATVVGRTRGERAAAE
jgi:short-subunit dehydrogenase